MSSNFDDVNDVVMQIYNDATFTGNNLYREGHGAVYVSKVKDAELVGYTGGAPRILPTISARIAFYSADKDYDGSTSDENPGNSDLGQGLGRILDSDGFTAIFNKYKTRFETPRYYSGDNAN